METTPSKLVPALIGGSIIAVLSTVPIINVGNCLCCMWVILGGFIACYLYSRDFKEGQILSGGDGALVGLLAGVFGALFGTFLSYFFMAVADYNPGREFIRSLLQSRQDIPPMLEQFLRSIEESGTINPVLALIDFFFSLIIDSIFGMIGGIIGASFFKKKGEEKSGK